MTTANSAFFYIDAEPTKGLWIDLDSLTDFQDIKESLAAKYRGSAENVEHIDEVLCADAEGLCRPFAGSYGSFDWEGFTKWAHYLDTNTHVEQSAVMAFIEHIGGDNTTEYFERSYRGEYDSERAFTYEYCSDALGMDDWPEIAQRYFDYESFARDLFIDGYSMHDGHVFADR